MKLKKSVFWEDVLGALLQYGLLLFLLLSHRLLLRLNHLLEVIKRW